MFFFILGFGSVFFGLGLGLVLVGESLELPDTRALLLAAVGEGFLNQDHVRDVFVIELLKVVVVEIGHGEVVSLGNRFFLKKKGGGGVTSHIGIYPKALSPACRTWPRWVRPWKVVSFLPKSLTRATSTSARTYCHKNKNKKWGGGSG